LLTRIISSATMDWPLRLFISVCVAAVVGCASTVTPEGTADRPSSPPPIAAATPRGSNPAGIDWTSLATAMRMPTIGTAICPRSIGHVVSKSYGAGLGDGPVYPVGVFVDGVLLVVAEAGVYRAKVLWVSAASYAGPVLIRGARLDGPGPVQFSAGNTQPVEQLRLLQPGAFSPDEEPGWREWPSYTVVPQPGCYAYQVDGTSFTNVIVFEARAVG
jgi:hypothetical protein